MTYSTVSIDGLSGRNLFKAPANLRDDKGDNWENLDWIWGEAFPARFIGPAHFLTFEMAIFIPGLSNDS